MGKIKLPWWAKAVQYSVSPVGDVELRLYLKPLWRIPQAGRDAFVQFCRDLVAL